MANLEPFNDKLNKMINKEEYRPCMFSGYCHSFACDRYYFSENCEFRKYPNSTKQGG